MKQTLHHIKMRTSSTLLPIAVLLLISYPSSATAQNARSAGIVCPNKDIFPDCVCETSSFHYPKMNPILRLELTPHREELDVICHDGFNNFAILPDLHIGNVNIMNVKECEAVVNQPLLQTIRFVGVNSTKQMYYNIWKSKIRYTAMFFEGLQDLEQLVLDEGVEYIESDAFSNLAHLQRLDIRRNDDLKLLPGVFDGLVSLYNLSLDRNGISELESGIFQNLQQLQKLDLGENRLRELSKSTFEGLENLKYLQLFYNNIESLSADAFSLLTNLTKLDLSGNPLTLISGNFTVNRKLETFILTDNEAPLVLSDYLLSHLQELQTVDLQNSKLNQLPENLFRESKAIVTLNLGNNGLKSLPESLLLDQCNLVNFNFEQNRLETLPDQLFETTTNLIELLLSRNHLHSISENVFATLAKLKELHLDNNNLHLIHDSAFKGTTSLEKLYLQNNSLSFNAMSSALQLLNIFERKPSPLQYLNNLHELDVSNNSITSIVHDWQLNISQLNKLNLSYNSISQLSGFTDLNFFSKNISIDLSHNQISNIFGLHRTRDMSLVTVRLTGNPLNCDCDLLEFVQYVEAKNKSHIQFATDDLLCSKPQELIGNFSTVKPLDLTCPLTGDDTGCPAKCNCNLRPADHTIVVDCTGQDLTNISSLPQTSPGNYRFIELHIEDNFIKQLPTSNLSGYDNVTKLHARNNSIDKISPENLPTHLSLVDLRYNELTALNKAVLDTLKKSANLSVQLSNNSWSCDCSNKDFMLFVQENHQKLSPDVRSDKIICEDGREVVSLTVNELCDEDTSLLIAICVIIACFGCLLGLTTAFYYSYEIEIKVWLFKHKLFLWFITEEELDKDKLYDAFISYSHQDALFVEDELVPRMENLMDFKTCVHVRDWMPGETIPAQIMSSVENSRRTVIVLSKHHLESTWAQMEFRVAHMLSLAEKRIRVIIIMVGDIGDVDSLDSEMKAYLKMNTYVKREDPWFWDKLRYAMPHPITTRELRAQIRRRNETELAVVVDKDTGEVRVGEPIEISQ